jgi:hypothetical protein
MKFAVNSNNLEMSSPWNQLAIVLSAFTEYPTIMAQLIFLYSSRYVEFYDTRVRQFFFWVVALVVVTKHGLQACDESFDRLRHQGLQDGVMDIVFAWDTTETAGPQGSQQQR